MSRPLRRVSQQILVKYYIRSPGIHWVGRICHLLALYFYDKLLVGHQEVDLIWRRKNIGFIVPTIYGAMHICTAFYIFMAFCPPPDASCKVCYLLNTDFSSSELILMTIISLSLV